MLETLQSTLGGAELRRTGDKGGIRSIRYINSKFHCSKEP